MTELPTNYIKFCAEETSILFQSNGALALDQLQALINALKAKNARIAELERFLSKANTRITELVTKQGDKQ